ncbi:MAG: HNH endonuclease [Hyphomicrobiaceae bacterium]|nr:MAG: HNH endonuclease [Hyphomicrobiaceae bacterium]
MSRVNAKAPNRAGERRTTVAENPRNLRCFGIIGALKRMTGAVLETPAGLTERHWRSNGMDQYNTRAQRKRRAPFSNATRQRILDYYDHTCVYCEYEATTVDHVIPYTYGGSDEDDNLVACCSICNSIASNKIFETFEGKRAFIRKRYGPYLEGRVRRERRKLSMCGDCGTVYQPRVNGASAVLCAECYAADEMGRRKRLIGEESPVYDLGGAS